ncbi:MAG TPA: DMT family transporter [Rhizomicrobium sp.]|nr:DMT family transporter [Rhizomicrobium sp.]
MNRPSLGIGLKLGATLAFSLMYACVKLAGDPPLGEAIFFRSFFALIPLFALAIFTIGPAHVVRTKRPGMHLLRSLAGVSSMFMNFAALETLPLADITAFSFVMPIFAVILAALILKERVGLYRSAAVAVGFGGVMLMIEPYGGIGAVISSGASKGAGLALGGSLFSAFVVVFIRQMSTTEKSETIVFYFMLTAAIAGGLVMIGDFVMPDAYMAFWLVMSGLLGGIGQICMTYSYRFAEPSLLAPFDYVAMVWATGLGYLLFQDVPQKMVLIGAGMVIAAGLFIVWRERRLHKKGLPLPASM